MHSFRLRYIALGLLIYVQSAFSKTCGTDFVDLASRTILSRAAFEGRVSRLEQRPDGRFLVHFSVRHLYKWNLTTEPHDANRSNLVVGEFGQTADAGACLAPIADIDADPRTFYIVFLNDTGQDADSGDQYTQPDDQYAYRNSTNSSSSNNSISSSSGRSVFYYRISSFPENATKQAVKEVKAFSSPKNALAPVVRVPLPKQPLKIGQKLQLACKISRGKPQPILRWFKDGVVVTKNSNRTLKSTKRGLILQVRKAATDDAGVYQCQAVNVVGQTVSQNVTIEMPTTTLPHVEYCANQNYCLNQGSCLLLMPLYQRFCVCVTGWEGKRCEEKENPLNRSELKKKRLFKRMQGPHT